MLDENLRRLGFDRSWLMKALKKQGENDPKKVFLMTADEDGNVFFCRKK